MLEKSRLTKEDKGGLAAALVKAGLMPAIPCQVVLHCVDGMVQVVEFQGLKMK